MRYVLSLIVAVTVLGAIQASSEEIALGVSLASVDNRVAVGSTRNDCPDGDWNTAAIKEGESESPEMTAVIENNREDRAQVGVNGQRPTRRASTSRRARRQTTPAKRSMGSSARCPRTSSRPFSRCSGT